MDRSQIRRLGRNAGTGTETKCIQEHSLVTCSLGLVELAFLCSLELPSHGDIVHNGLRPPKSIINQENTATDVNLQVKRMEAIL